MIPTSIKRFSRSKIQEEAETLMPEPKQDDIPEPMPEPSQEPIAEPVKKSRAPRAKKVKIQDTPTQISEPVEPPPESHHFDESFLSGLKVPKNDPTTPMNSPAMLTPEEAILAQVNAMDTIHFDMGDVIPRKGKGTKKKKDQVNNLAIPDIEASFFSDKPTQILGAERRSLLVKCAQYKKCFPQELKEFRLKKNASVEELKEAIDEMDVIISLSSIENFLTDCILQGITVMESVSSRTEKFDISGTAESLKQNPLFLSLCKQMYLKYGAFSAVPPEIQLGMLITTTMYLHMHRNAKVKTLGNRLDETMVSS